MKMLFRFSLLLRFRSFVHSLIRRCYEYFLYFFSTFPCLAQLVLGWRYMNSEFLTAQSQFPIRLERRKHFLGTIGMCSGHGSLQVLCMRTSTFSPPNFFLSLPLSHFGIELLYLSKDIIKQTDLHGDTWDDHKKRNRGRKFL